MQESNTKMKRKKKKEGKKKNTNRIWNWWKIPFEAFSGRHIIMYDSTIGWIFIYFFPCCLSLSFSRKLISFNEAFIFVTSLWISLFISSTFLVTFESDFATSSCKHFSNLSDKKPIKKKKVRKKERMREGKIDRKK